jgi:Cu-Zn family superoxide dismutase
MTIKPAYPMAVLLAAACGASRSDPAAVPPTRTATLVDSTGKTIGSAALLSSSRGPLLVVRLTGVAPGTHGLHIHEAARCDPPAFESAGPHLNPARRQHGSRNPAGPHLGDLPNVRASAAGAIDTTLVLDRAVLGSDGLGSGAPGRALVLHARADDLMTDPSGNSGARIACGVLNP